MLQDLRTSDAMGKSWLPKSVDFWYRWFSTLEPVKWMLEALLFRKGRFIVFYLWILLCCNSLVLHFSLFPSIGWWDRDQRPQTFVHISGRSGGCSARRLVFGRPKATELAMRKKVNGLLTGDVEALIQATMASRIRDSFQQTWQHVFFEVDVLFVLQKSWWQRRYVGWVDGFPFKLSRLRTFP